MKRKLIIIGFAVLLILTNIITCYAATEISVTLHADKTEVKAGETFTVTLKATCPDGINGVVTTYSYEEDKLEYVSENVADSDNYAFGGNKETKEIFVYCISTDSIQEADVYTLTFRVKEGVEPDSTATVSITETTLDSDAAEDSEHKISVQPINITVVSDEEKDGGGDETCSHTTYEAKYNDTYHWDECSKCNEIKEGSRKLHTYGTYTDNGDGTHSTTCTVCGYELIEDHNFIDGECIHCNAVDPKAGAGDECNHTYGSYTDKGNGTHTATCSKCGDKITESHKIDKACDKCGYTPKGSDGSSNKDGSNNNSAIKEYPKAGLNTLLAVGILIILIIAVVMYRKNQKYQDIK